MKTRSSASLSTLNPCHRPLVSSRNSSFLGFVPLKLKSRRLLLIDNLSKFQANSGNGCRFHIRVLGHGCVIDSNHTAFCGSDSNWGQSRVCYTSSTHPWRGRGVSVIGKVASDIRNHSTSLEAHVNEKSFESVYVQGGLNVRPLDFERIDNGAHLKKEEESRVKYSGSNVDIGNSKGLNGNVVSIPESEASEIERDAWKLLREAVVSYYGNSVGTIAANNPGDKQLLNYDQIFIRDFVPSALAFLLNGEGEIVKNFLLHTLQLQVSYDVIVSLFNFHFFPTC